ncbi:hypothetical protein EDC04DRAFT_2682442 [Pisolithus marmoratus]|nr:hypothetical protein EDC04DRAFT_2682442 [Pisolithus marmoratus]
MLIRYSKYTSLQRFLVPLVLDGHRNITGPPRDHSYHVLHGCVGITWRPASSLCVPVIDFGTWDCPGYSFPETSPARVRNLRYVDMPPVGLFSLLYLFSCGWQIREKKKARNDFDPFNALIRVQALAASTITTESCLRRALHVMFHMHLHKITGRICADRNNCYLSWTHLGHGPFRYYGRPGLGNGA